jgi:hypothetical protein
LAIKLERIARMKKTFTLVLAAAACCAAFTGCASKDNVDSNPDSSMAVTDSSYYSSESSMYEDSSRTIPERVGSTVDDVIDGGKRVVDDTASTAKDVVDNVTR